MDKNIVITGVGGQGTLLAARIIGGAALASGFDVKVSEVHGMSQRGGNVVTYVKYSNSKVNSPVVENGTADIVLAFEQLEAYRAVPALKPGGVVIANEQKIDPLPVITGAAEYPSDIFEKIKGLGQGVKLISLDALSLAEQAGNPKTANVVLIGVLAAFTGISGEIWLDVLKKEVPERFLNENLKAFETGYSYSGLKRDCEGEQ